MQTVIGMMSGTSMDGVDAAVLVTDGVTIEGAGPTLFRPYAESEKSLLRKALAEARTIADRTARPPAPCGGRSDGDRGPCRGRGGASPELRETGATRFNSIGKPCSMRRSGG